LERRFMKRLRRGAIVAFALPERACWLSLFACLLGCGPAAPPAAESPTASAPADGAPSNPTTSSTTSEHRGFPLSVSAGVALPQSLPEGTTVMVSVDYNFTDGGAPGATPALCRITPTTGEAVEYEVELLVRGTWQAALLSMKPEQGPFRAQFFEPEGDPPRPLSAEIDLR
jgi:hypothetical protein